MQGKPLAYTPFCDNNRAMDGFRFWKQGFWQDHLAGRPYHISALYVVDLARFRCARLGFYVVVQAVSLVHAVVHVLRFHVCLCCSHTAGADSRMILAGSVVFDGTAAATRYAAEPLTQDPEPHGSAAMCSRPCRL